MSTVHLNEKSFAETVKNGIVILDWWASWCGPCLAFAPIFEKASEEHPDVVFGKINTDEEQQLSGAFRVEAIPTLMVFRDGILLFNQPGMIGAEDINELLSRVRKLDMEEVRRQIAEAKAKESGGPQGSGDASKPN